MRWTLRVIVFMLMGASAWAFPGGVGDHEPLPAPQIGTFRTRNAGNLERLQVGMTRQQVSGVMGDANPVQTYNLYTKAELLPNPHRVESRRGKGLEELEVRYYFAYQNKADGRITLDELCPVILREGILQGWGWEYYEKALGSPAVVL